MTEHKKHLYNLDELSDYKVADGYPNVKGWDVKDIDNRVIGKVDNLLVNKEAQRVVYLDVEVDKSIIDAKHDPYEGAIQDDIKEFINKDGENHVIIPIGLVNVNEDSDYVYTDRINHRTFSGTKRYRKGDTINRQYENQVLSSYGRTENEEDDDNFNISSNNIKNESRIRDIVREEIRKYHNKYGNKTERYSDDVDDAVVISDEEMDLHRRRQNNDVYDDDDFYERDEFKNERFRDRNRTPGL
ncbi:MAG: PRC-barrel domain-containing protein [Aquaticitalea sp.]